MDTFQDGTTMGWVEGAISPNPPTNVANGGPGGVGDRYLQNIASGPPSGAGSKQIMFNRTQWAGDYAAAGITRIDAMVNNLGANDLYLRLALEGDFFERYASTNAIHLPAGSGWQAVSFDLGPAGLTQISGTDPLATVLGGISEVRILSAQSGPTWFGDDVLSILGVDNLTAAPEPGSLLLLVAGALVVRRRR